MGEERYQEVREALVWKESIGMNREAQEVWHDAGTDRLGPVAEEQDGSQRCRYELVDDAERDGNCRYHCALVGEEHDGAAWAAEALLGDAPVAQVAQAAEGVLAGTADVA